MDSVKTHQQHYNDLVLSTDSVIMITYCVHSHCCCLKNNIIRMVLKVVFKDDIKSPHSDLLVQEYPVNSSETVPCHLLHSSAFKSLSANVSDGNVSSAIIESVLIYSIIIWSAVLV